ncbi:hypothetical protein ASC77_19450 [Nocardioides sp. Root1257]|uniref:hypothetical protein n=1 Tax=unclassified Nocardioides TaxID=2615069 RepID=UPI0006F916FB|nr:MULTISPECIES: hypothetical protein [unclassified Nocardioides]KQW46071.1 hypothetical protein ASC77_19450 [Nocardioides sp. Root1257]KRC43333.1 hypothetical protein ASE24_20415 [Nocardioides sp. Root224]
MSDDDRLRDQLQALVPHPPPTPGRAAAARDLHHRSRRRTTVAVVTVAAVAVVALATAPLLTSGDEPGVTRPATQTPTPTPSPADPEAFTCPAPRAQADTDTVPAGATAVHLCAGSGTGFDAPTDALVTDVDELAGVVNRQPLVTAPGQNVCQTDLGPGYVLAFEYADGSIVPVGGDLYGCHELRVGTSTRGHPERPWSRFIALLRAQRAASRVAPRIPHRPACGDQRFDTGRGISPVAGPDEMVAATLCVSYQTETEHDPQGVPVPARDLAILLADRASHHDPVSTEDCDPDTPSWELVGATAWGDLVTADGWCGAWNDGRGIGGPPGPAAQRVLDRLVGHTGRPVPTVDATSTAEQVVAAYVDLLNADLRDEALALWHPLGTPDLPVGYGHVDAKVESVRPLRSISAYGDATAVTALYREVPPDGAFTDYREATFTLGRDQQGVFRIVHVDLGKVVPTGR